MCDPISIGSMAVGALGSAISGYEASENQAAQINARNGATQAEMERQRAYGGRTRESFDSSMKVYEPDAQRRGLADAQTSVGETLTRNAPTDVGSITTAGAPRVVGASESGRVADVFRQGAARDKGMAALKGYGQQQFGNNIALGGNARDIDMVGDFAKFSSGVSAMEQRAAGNNARRSASGLGDILKFAGSVGANRAGRGGTGLNLVRTGGLY